MFEADAWEKLGMFLISGSFFVVCLMYSAVSENIGHHVFLNFLTGKYHRPKKEERIFMFLDMKKSTTIAEKLGHEQYFNLLRDYYVVMSDPIINTLGEVYQYIGDEVVITWNASKGLKNNNCLKCFKQIKERMTDDSDTFNKKYGVTPDFKAGLNVGEVTTGEIGAKKRDILHRRCS